MRLGFGFQYKRRFAPISVNFLPLCVFVVRLSGSRRQVKT